jgi:hypothetical protein
VVDVVAVAHLYQGVAARVTDAPFRLVAIDGTDLVRPTPVRDAAIPGHRAVHRRGRVGQPARVRPAPNQHPDAVRVVRFR